jgi:hypothetical protein
MPDTPYFYQVLPTFAPQMMVVTAISRTNPAVITTLAPSNYLNGAIIRVYVPKGFGMYQMNQQTGTVTVIDPLNFSINVDASSFDPFVVPNPRYQQSSVVNVGEVNTQLDSAIRNILPPIGGGS